LTGCKQEQLQKQPGTNWNYHGNQRLACVRRGGQARGTQSSKFKVQGSKLKPIHSYPLQFSPINWVVLLLPFPAGHYPLSPDHYSCPYVKEQARERLTFQHYHRSMGLQHDLFMFFCAPPRLSAKDSSCKRLTMQVAVAVCIIQRFVGLICSRPASAPWRGSASQFLAIIWPRCGFVSPLPTSAGRGRGIPHKR